MVLKDGCVIEAGEVEAVFAKPNADYTKNY